MGESRPLSISRILVALGLSLAFVPGAAAATVELLVIDELDQGVANTQVALRRIEAVGNRSYFRLRDMTDPGGRVVLEGVEPGRYSVHVFGVREDFVSLPNHPSIERTSITVVNQQEQLRSTVRLIRGTPVVFRVSVDGQELPGARVMLHDLDREYRTDIGMGERVEREVRLVAGRWTAHVDPVPGYLLTSVEVNRTPFSNDLAEFDLPPGTQAWYVTFEFAAPAHLWGRITFEDEPFGIRIVSHLQEAGAWLPAVQARGGSKFEVVWASPVYPTWEYEMVVPDGRWIVRPEADGLEHAEPPQLEVRLEPGEYRRIDFVVSGGSSGGGRWTYVRVEDGERKRVPDAVAEAWPAEENAREDSPIAKAKTRGWSDAILRGLGDEEYLFVAGKPGYVETSTILKTPDASKGRRVRLQLGRGTTVHAVARDEDDEGIAAVEVSLVRQDDFVSLLSSPDIVEWAQRPTDTTDGTGHLWMRGVYPGRFILSGTFQGDDTTMFFAEFRNDGDTRWERELEKEYRGNETDEIEIRLAPAGSVRATMHCSDGSELPPEADILVLGGDRLYSSKERNSWTEHAVQQRKAHVLEGEARDGFHVGPLELGAYHVLVRPEEHNRWTWALGTESPEDSSILSITPGEPADLGAIAVDCAPAIEVIPQVPDSVELPDLVATGLYEPLAECNGVLTIDGEERELDHARLVAEPWRVQFRDLPEGNAKLQVTVWNPFFLPRPDWVIPVSAELERGRTVEVRPQVPGIGGAIDLLLPESPRFEAVVVVALGDDTKEDVEPWIFEIDGRSILIPSLPQGKYDVAACLDAACEQRVDLWAPVEVQPGVLSVPGELEPQASNQSDSGVGSSVRGSGLKIAQSRTIARIAGTINTASAGKTLAKPVRLLIQPPSTPPIDPAPKVIKK